MVKTLTLFNIISGIASIVGVIGEISNPQKQWPKELLLPLFIFSGFLCLYVLLVPDSFFEKNVKKKIAFYSKKNTFGKLDDILIQRGIVRLRGNRKTIEFYVPFSDIPEFELLDVPTSEFAIGVTAQSVIIKRKDPNDSRRYRSRWIARGTPLQRTESIKVE